MSRNCIQLLNTAMLQNQTFVCCGLDPDLRRLPIEIIRRNSSDRERVADFLRAVIDSTAEHVCAYKIQKAFFEILPGGHSLVRECVDYIQSKYPHLPVFLDCKIGDIENTMLAYLENVFDGLHVDGVVVNPYMGDDVMSPFMTLPEKAAIVLVKTSNSGGSVVQDVTLSNGRPLWRHILDLIVQRWNRANNLIPVLTTTAEIDPQSLRMLIPNSMPILLAGFGTQGGRANNFSRFLNKQGSGVFVNSSRGILYSFLPDEPNWEVAIYTAASQMKEYLNSKAKVK